MGGKAERCLLRLTGMQSLERLSVMCCSEVRTCTDPCCRYGCTAGSPSGVSHVTGWLWLAYSAVRDANQPRRHSVSDSCTAARTYDDGGRVR